MKYLQELEAVGILVYDLGIGCCVCLFGEKRGCEVVCSEMIALSFNVIRREVVGGLPKFQEINSLTLKERPDFST
jgi:hypothetical protein